MQSQMARQDALQLLGEAVGLPARMDLLYQTLRQRHPVIHRVAVALFDSGSSSLRTYVYAGDQDSPLMHYESAVAQAPELAKLLESRQARVIQDLSIYATGEHTHTRVLSEAGFRASYTLPFYWNNRFEAFLFFNSRNVNCLTPEILVDLDLFAHLIGSLVMSELLPLRTLMAALRVAVHMVHMKDPETGNHLERMARYSRLIARSLAGSGKQPFDDNYIEYLAAFAPLHDVGKIGVPDEVLMKKGLLDTQEFEVMKHHPGLGREIVDGILKDFGLEALEYVEMLRQVAEGHHEMLDGSGYPHAYKGVEIPIAARIIAVADIFDALTSHRPYKEPWPNDVAFEYLLRQAEQRLDPDCVSALMANLEEIERIQANFKDA